MKSPEALARRLAQQWANAQLREARLLQRDAWPISLPIGTPHAGDVKHNLAHVREHLSAWQQVPVGTIKWQSRAYRSLAEEISVPVAWELHKPSEWAQATGDKGVRKEFERLSVIIERTDPAFHQFLIRQRHLISRVPTDEIILAANVSAALSPGIAGGAPLRALSINGIDSKFLERNRSLVTRLLDIRFDGAVTDAGLENFLGATPSSDQWLLVIDLDGELLPFEQVRLRDSELKTSPLPGERVLIVENERCGHVLPRVKGCIAILGAGLNLAWMQAQWLDDRAVAYWGDIDTWGLTMLARARGYQTSVVPLLMTQLIFQQFGDRIVAEPVPASSDAPSSLSSSETALYEMLIQSERGRLEQEFLPESIVTAAIQGWAILE